MAHYRATVGSRRSAADTFDYMVTFSNSVNWDPGVFTSEPLDPGPARVGTRFLRAVPSLAAGCL